MFNHIPISTPIIETAHNEDGHFYSIDGDIYPSITTILHSIPNPGIEFWKAKTPNWREITNESLMIGTNLHSTIEKYLKNETVDKIDEKSYELFCNLTEELDKIDNIQALETGLYHKDLKIAGRVDCIAEYNGEKCIIDFKNSRKPKKEYYVKKSGYYEQLTAYAKMWEYCTGQKIDTGVVIIANWDNTISTHKINISDYHDSLMDILERYYNG